MTTKADDERFAQHASIGAIDAAPFRDRAERDRWADEHATTGHDVVRRDGETQ